MHDYEWDQVLVGRKPNKGIDFILESKREDDENNKILQSLYQIAYDIDTKFFSSRKNKKMYTLNPSRENFSKIPLSVQVSLFPLTHNA